MKRTTVTSTTGQSIAMPAKFAEGLSQTSVDTLVSDAYSAHPLAVAVTRSLQVEKA